MIHLFKIRSFHSSHLCLPFSYFFWKFGKLMVLTVNTSSRWELETLCHTLSLICTSRALETVYLLIYSVHLWNYNFLWVRDGYSESVTRNFLKDTAIFVKQLLLKVRYNGKVYHSLKRCISSAFKLLFKGAATS